MHGSVLRQVAARHRTHRSCVYTAIGMLKPLNPKASRVDGFRIAHHVTDAADGIDPK